MKLTLEYSVHFEPIAPEKLAAYLQTNGWHEDGYFSDNATLWHLPEDKKIRGRSLRFYYP